MNRRDALAGIANGLGLALVMGKGRAVSAQTAAAMDEAAEDWQLAETIRARIAPPSFPQRDFDITGFGARADGRTDCTDAIRRAVSACAVAGGGRVLVRGGTFRSGPIHLRSNVNLHVDAGAAISFIPEPQRYLPPVFTRFEGTELMNYSPLIYAFEQENIAVTGAGTLEGGADEATWWPWKGEQWYRSNLWQDVYRRLVAERRIDAEEHQQEAVERLRAMAEAQTPPAERVFGAGRFLRPSFIQPYRCRNVLIEGVTIRQAPMWIVHPVLCENVTVRGITVQSLGPNNDGCNPESCRDVLIENCMFDTGDDCIAIKSGRNADGRRLETASENILVSGCLMRAGHGGVVIGSEISGGARNIIVEHCRMDSPDLWFALRIKTNSVRGGVVERIRLRNIDIGEVKHTLLRINYHYEEGDVGQFPPVVRDIELRDIACRQTTCALSLLAYERAPARDIRLVDVRIENVRARSTIEHIEALSLQNVIIDRYSTPREGDACAPGGTR